MEMKICADCKTEKSASEFHPRRNRKGGKGLRSYCKVCEKVRRRKQYVENPEKYIACSRAWQEANKERWNEYRHRYERSPEGRARRKRYQESEYGKKTMRAYQKSDTRRAVAKAWRQRNREKAQAIWHVWKAVKDGRLIRPSICERCGQESINKLHGHHHKGYAPEHRLDVIWLCIPCHEAVHHDLDTTG